MCCEGADPIWIVSTHRLIKVSGSANLLYFPVPFELSLKLKKVLVLLSDQDSAPYDGHQQSGFKAPDKPIDSWAWLELSLSFRGVELEGHIVIESSFLICSIPHRQGLLLKPA